MNIANPYGRYQGFITADHAPAVNAKLFEMKLCEHCGAAFMRPIAITAPFILKSDHSEVRRDTGIRYCIHCQMRGTSPVDLSSYKELHPGTEQQMRHALHLPKYDRPKDPQTKTPRKYTRSYEGWEDKLRVALGSGPMTRIAIADVIGCSMTALYSRLVKFDLEIVGNVWPRPSCMGVNPKLYQLRNVNLA